VGGACPGFVGMLGVLWRLKMSNSAIKAQPHPCFPRKHRQFL